MGVCQWIMIILAFTSLVCSLARHGNRKEGYYSFGFDLVGWLIQMGLLFFGGFFE